MIRRLIIVLLIALAPSPAFAWWEYGHQTAARIAYLNVSPHTRAENRPAAPLDCPRQSKSGPGDRTTRRWWQAEGLTEGDPALQRRGAPSTIRLRRTVPLPVPGRI
jgi:hypothetical protein